MTYSPHSALPDPIVGAIQFDVILGNMEANLAAVLDALAVLSSRGAQLAVLPEMWSCGFDNLSLAIHAARTPSILAALAEKAKQYQIMIIGSMPEMEGNRIYNTIFVMDKNGALAGVYRKLHLFTPTHENDFFHAGERMVLCPTPFGSIGLMICYDLRFPELCRALALKGARMIIICAQWPAARITHWDALLRARAIENQIFVLAANRCGQDGNLKYGGHSALIDPFGTLIAKAGAQAEILSGQLRMDDIDDCRAKIPCLQERRPEIYGL